MSMMNIYQQFSYVNSRLAKSCTTKILGRTKKLTLSSEKYNNYMESFSNLSQKKLFEMKMNFNLPNIINTKESVKKSHSFLKIKRVLTPKMQEKLFSIFNLSSLSNSQNDKKNTSNKTSKNKNINFFICDFDYFNQDEINIKTNINNYNFNNKNKLCLTQRNFYNSKSNFKNMFKEKNIFKNKFKNKDSKNNIIKDYSEKKTQKQIFCLLDSVFNEKKKKIKEKEKYENEKNENENEKSESENGKEKEKLIYDENKIFGYKNIYLDYLKKELTSLINNEKQMNMNSNISYNYDNILYGKIIMELNSAKIEVINKVNDEICCKVDIPFNLLCLFYLSNVRQLSYIVLNIFKNDFFLKNEKIPNMLELLEHIIKKQISYTNEILTFQNNFEDQGKNNMVADYINYRNYKLRTSVRYNFLSLTLKPKVMNQIVFENCTYNSNSNNSIFNLNYNHNIVNYNENIETTKNMFDTNINIINLSWITLDNNYIIRITMPQIIVKLPKYKKQINHFIDKQLLLFLYQNNFKDWNFYISHYLFSLKKFRSCINNILSYYTLYKLMKNQNIKNFFFNEHKINKTMKEINEDNIDMNTNVEENNINNYEKYNISNIKFEEYENSLNDNEYIFFVSDDENIHLYKMKSYVLYAYSCRDLKHPQINYFDFSFYQMKILYYKSKYENLANFLQRLIKVNNDKKKVYFDYYYFNTFKSMNNKQIDNYFMESIIFNNLNNLKINNINHKSDKSNVNNENNNDALNQIVVNDFIIKVSNPKFVSVSIKKNKDINFSDMEEKWEKKEGEIGRNLIEKLVENDIKNWGTILWQNKDGIEALKKKKINSGFKNLFKGKKDFKAVFKKFLKIK